jgi:glutamyl-tRNA(Gln) amidotransferase subunit E
VDALDGVPNETRQPFPDGHTDFERILPGPDRMYPDTDSPPHRVTENRVASLRAALPDPPWVREERYAAAGVPRPVIHYLVRRGGARHVDRLAAEGASLRFACFFFGERLKGLSRAGVPVARIRDEAWSALFVLFRELPVLVESWKALVRALAADPSADPAAIAAGLELGAAPPGWAERLPRDLPDHPDGTAAQRTRFRMGRVMSELRGRVPAAAVREEVERDS